MIDQSIGINKDETFFGNKDLHDATYKEGNTKISDVSREFGE